MRSQIIDFLEEFEYYPENTTSENRAWFCLGIILMLIGLSVLVVGAFVSMPIATSWFNPFVFLAAMVTVGAGTFLATRFISRDRFKTINQWLERHIWGASDTILAFVAIIIVTVIAVALLFLNFPGHENTSTRDLLWQLSPLMYIGLILGLVHLGLRTGQIRLGITGNRARLRAGVFSRWIDSIVWLSFLALPVGIVGVIEDGSAWIAVAMTVTFTVIGMHFTRARRFDEGVRNMLERFNRIRENCLRVGADTDLEPIYKEVRLLQLDLAGHPRVEGRPFTFQGLLALCIVVDARARRAGDWLTFTGETRTEHARRVFYLYDTEFAKQLGLVFDALLLQIDRGFAPGMRKVNEDLRCVYERINQNEVRTLRSS